MTAAAPAPDGGPALYPVPQAVPRLPETFSPRPTEYRLLFDELLGRASGKSAGKVLAYGMGACGMVAVHAQPSVWYMVVVRRGGTLLCYASVR